MNKLPVLLIALITLLASCGKESAPGNSNTPPTNLVLTAVVNPDNSGNVAFTATATNAVSYDYDYGNGIYKTVPAGIITYKYPASGTYTVNVVAKSSSGQTISKSIQVTVTVAMALVWSDEFNTDGAPDASKWGYDLGAGGWGNGELQYYTNRSENAVVQGGMLKIKMIKENFSGSPYTSARLLSKNKYAFTYGKVEARAKLPLGRGTWPAIWMLGSNISTAPWPACGEIDIMEHVGNDQDRIYGTLHYPGRSGGNADGASKIISNVSTEFHIYSLEWSATSIKMFADGQLIHAVGNTTNIPFNHDFFLILNMAMGGAFGGNVDPTLTAATLEIDYIRVYQ
jgi:beta-glucanase (GH16 family)